MLKLIKKKPKKPISLRDHYERRNRVLIKRRGGGFGDILMQRMLFEDFHKAMPGIELSFTCPYHYLEMAKNHPFATALDLSHVNEDEFGAVYDISTACRVHETRYGADNRDHRSDIWANYCGVSLQNHDMHLTAQPERIEECRHVLESHNRDHKPVVLLATQSTTDDFGKCKSLLPEQISEIVWSLREKYYVCTVHGERQAIYDQLGVDQFTSLHPQSWIGLVAAVDYVISVDTSTFHLAGGLKKPLVGVFTFTDGKVYGKYYDFVLVQKHRDNGDWDCGPCFNMGFCPKTEQYPKPCLTEIKASDILRGFYEATKRWPCGGNGQGIAGISLPVHTSETHSCQTKV